MRGASQGGAGATSAVSMCLRFGRVLMILDSCTCVSYSRQVRSGCADGVHNDGVDMARLRDRLLQIARGLYG